METCLINLRKVLVLLVLGCFLGGMTLAPAVPALAQTPAGPQVLMEKPEEGAKPETVIAGMGAEQQDVHGFIPWS